MTAFVGNSNLLQLLALTDELTDAFINDATVTATVVDQEGVEVEGMTWPLAMAYVEDSDGDYLGVIEPDVEFAAGKCYIAQITADAGPGSTGYWEFHFTPLTRGAEE